MLTRKLQPRHDRNALATRRRGALFMRGVFDRFQSFKLRVKNGRKNPIRWWQSTYQHFKPWRSRND
jgi:hypothetical protein